MEEHPNARRVREVFAALEKKDVATMMDAVADDVRWHFIGSDEPVVGKEALFTTFGPDADREFAIDVDVHDVVANDKHAIALVQAHATKSGRTFGYRTVEIMHIEDGKVAERWAFSDDTAAVAEFFS